jgi:CRISPR/Cas system-associated protein Cas10 (large subunit of type III CRISPR-Cas system)
MITSTAKEIRNRFSKLNNDFKKFNQKLKGIGKRITKKFPDLERRQPDLERRQSNLERETQSRINWQYRYLQDFRDSQNQLACQPREPYRSDELPPAFTWKLETEIDEEGVSMATLTYYEVIC